MNYYWHHIGDYAAATGHLSWDEDMAYTRLLRAYYSTERGIPDGEQYRYARAASKAQRSAVDAVLREFFTLKDGFWTQKRCEEEIAVAKDKREKAQRSANARWKGRENASDRNANASPNAMRTHSEGNAPNPNPNPKLSVGNSPPDSSISNARDVVPSGVGESPPREIVTENPALPAVVALRKRGGVWLRLTPDNPEIITAVREGVTLEALEAWADAYPDKPPLYVIRAARRERADGAQPIAGGSHATPTRSRPSAVERVEAAIRERRANTAQPGSAGLPVGTDGSPLREPLDVASG